MYDRRIGLPADGGESFFLWGPRLTGKTTLLRSLYPRALWVDLLQADVFSLHTREPEALRQRLRATPEIRQIVIDEIQKVPRLLDEVHWLIENRGLQFILCGSSTRSVRRGRANLLGGRALRYELCGLSAVEIGTELDLTRLLNQGYLPSLYNTQRPRKLLEAYVGSYLREEVASEGAVRNLPAFANFLAMAALADGDPVNYSTMARECGVSSNTVQNYFEVLIDTLQGRWLPSYQKRPKRRIIRAAKFYFVDGGVVNHLCRRGPLSPGSELYGKAFENWLCHELHAYNAYTERFAHLAYWRLTNMTEVDFIVNEMELAIESKSSRRIEAQYLKGLRQLKVEHPEIRRRVIVCSESHARITDDGIEILPAANFIAKLWGGELF